MVYRPVKAGWPVKTSIRIEPSAKTSHRSSIAAPSPRRLLGRHVRRCAQHGARQRKVGARAARRVVMTDSSVADPTPSTVGLTVALVRHRTLARPQSMT